MDLFLTVIAFIWIGLAFTAVFTRSWYFRRLYNKQTKPDDPALTIFYGLLAKGITIWGILHLADRFGVVTYSG